MAGIRTESSSDASTRPSAIHPSSPVRLALIGCGALAEHGYLPAIRDSERASVTLLVDPDRDRTRRLADQWQIPGTADNPTAIEASAGGGVDAAIVAVPNHLHAPVAVDLLRRKIPVLLEKPMALNVAECDEILRASRDHGTTLGIGFVCRFARAARLAKHLIASRTFGRVRSFQAENGWIFSWPLASDYLFHREKAGGGVLIDLGPHLLDLLGWWLGPLSVTDHFDDNCGGVEADSLTRLATKDGCSGSVRLSRTCNLKQRIFLKCESATLEVRLDRPSCKIVLRDCGLRLDGNIAEADAAPDEPETFPQLLRAQIDDWAEAVTNHRPPSADGNAGRRTIALIEECYTRRHTLELPWVSR